VIICCCAAWDYSAWVRNYALYLEEKLESFRVLNYDVEKDPLVGNLIQFALVYNICYPNLVMV